MFPTILKDILGYIPQVENQLTACISVTLVIDERIHQPELYILHVGAFEVGGVQLSADPGPSIRWIGKGISRSLRVEVIRTPFSRIICQVEGEQGLGLSLHQILVREYLVPEYPTGEWRGKIFVRNPVRTLETVEYRVDGIPVQEGPVVVVRQVGVAHFSSIANGCTREVPGLR